MVIGFLAGHACVRVQKEMLALLEKGHEVHIASQKVPSYVNYYRTFTQCYDMHQMVEAIKLLSNVVDIFHAHNEPSWFVTAVKENTDIPVILDVHDSYLARLTCEEEEKIREEGKRVFRVTSEERNNFQLADGLVFPGDRFRELVTDEFKLNQPAITLPSYLPDTLYRYDYAEWFGGLVYEGRVDIGSEIDEKPELSGFRYCDYEEMAKKTQELGIQFHIYTTRKDDKFKKVYEDICFLNEPQPFDKLIQKLAGHDWGLVGNVFPTSEWDVAMPNKLFEYMAACVPIVAINARDCGEFIEKHGIGISVNSLEELKERWSEHRTCRQKLIKVRKQFTMDKHIHDLERLYETVKGDVCKLKSIGKSNGNKELIKQQENLKVISVS